MAAAAATTIEMVSATVTVAAEVCRSVAIGVRSTAKE
jgi:hypothetical protein